MKNKGKKVRGKAAPSDKSKRAGVETPALSLAGRAFGESAG